MPTDESWPPCLPSSGRLPRPRPTTPGPTSSCRTSSLPPSRNSSTSCTPGRQGNSPKVISKWQLVCAVCESMEILTVRVSLTRRTRIEKSENAMWNIYHFVLDTRQWSCTYLSECDQPAGVLQHTNTSIRTVDGGVSRMEPIRLGPRPGTEGNWKILNWQF